MKVIKIRDIDTRLLVKVLYECIRKYLIKKKVTYSSLHVLIRV